MNLSQAFPTALTYEIQGYSVTFPHPNLAAVVIAWMSETYDEWEFHMEAISFEEREARHYEIARRESNRKYFKTACFVCTVDGGGTLWSKIAHLEKDLPL
jgi:hypothetical protein